MIYSFKFNFEEIWISNKSSVSLVTGAKMQGTQS